MVSVSNAVQILMANRMLRDETEASAFLDALETLSSSEPDPELIHCLFDIFTDEELISPPMDSLLNYIWWTFDGSLVVECLVDATPTLSRSAWNWAKTSYIRALARPERIIALKIAYSNAIPETQAQVRNIVNSIGHGPGWSSEDKQEIENSIRFVLD